jgi:DNA-binding phage protein
MSEDDQFPSTIAVRTYTVCKNEQFTTNGPSDIGYSNWLLILDTETTTDELQNLRFGSFQLRKLGEIQRRGFFFDDRTLAPSELQLLYDHCVDKDIELLSVEQFVEEIFFSYVYDLDALCIGFNLPFDISRLAIDCAPARRGMRGGFSFKLSNNRDRPRVRIKQLENGAHFIQFSRPAPREFNPQVLRRPGFFLDTRTLASAMLGRSAWSLRSLAKHLRTPTQKLETEGHGQTLTRAYLDYAMSDVQVTWECFERLKKQYESFCLSLTPINRIYSEASIGKAYLKQMGVKPFREKQPDFPPEILGWIMSSFYGGRSEVRIRCQCVQVVYADFRSMYPTVSILQGLWPFVTADRIDMKDATSHVRDLLSNIRLEMLQTPRLWKELNVLVQILPQGDVLPVRAPYSRFSEELSTGLNHLTHHRPMWFTLADCIASTLLTGKPPEVIKAIRFVPSGPQDGLSPIQLFGNPEYEVDPVTDDFYKALIDLRNDVKAQMSKSRRVKRSRLDIEQSALKTCANATSYGIFIELNTDEYDRNQTVTCYGYDAPFPSNVKSIEKPGKYFHPLVATLTTGAARLMLAITETMARAEGLAWAFCDTDSMALAKPEGMPEREFFERVRRVKQWFARLNPYKQEASLLKIEDENFAPGDATHCSELEALYCWAVSAKRYALFNLDDSGEPFLRKATEHGLGNLLVSNRTDNDSLQTSKLRVLSPWDRFWGAIVKAGLEGHHTEVVVDDLTFLKDPAVSQYTTSNPTLHGWFKERNKGRGYRKRIKPFNFFLIPRPKVNWANPCRDRPAPVAPYDNDVNKSLKNCYDRKTGALIDPSELKTCQEALAQFYLHPESKFSNADYLDTGETGRRHIIAMAVEQIGKESNRLDEQWHTGPIEDAQIHYGFVPSDIEHLIEVLRKVASKFGTSELADTADISRGHLERILKKQSPLSRKLLARVLKAMRILEENERQGARAFVPTASRAGKK